MVKRSASEMMGYHQEQAEKAKLKIRVSEYKAAHEHNIGLLRLRGQLHAAAEREFDRLPVLAEQLDICARAILSSLEESMRNPAIEAETANEE